MDKDFEVLRKLSNSLGEKEVEEIIEALRRPPERYYLRVNTIKSSVKEVLSCLREEGIRAKRDEKLSEAIWMKVEGPNEIEISGEEKEVVADKFAAESVYQGSNLYAPGVIKSKRVNPGDEVIIKAPNGVIVGKGVARMSSREMLVRKNGIAVETKQSVYLIPKIRETRAYLDGKIYPQSLPSMISSLALDPSPGERILDMCSSPGGKATHIAQITNNKSEIIALDVRNSRIRKLKENISRMRAKVRVIKMDARNSQILGKFDKVILDPPCSALGVRPKLFETKNEKEIEVLSRYQYSLARVIPKVLKRGGEVVYCTCTLTLEENEKIVEKLTELGLEVIEHEPFLGDKGIGEYHFSDRVQRFYPNRLPVPGFFIAKLRC